MKALYLEPLEPHYIIMFFLVRWGRELRDNVLYGLVCSSVNLVWCQFISLISTSLIQTPQMF